MKTAIIIHGYVDKVEYLDKSYPSPSNSHWFPWLQKQLLLKGVEVQTPEMPGFYNPDYRKWKEMLERFTPDENTVLIGHSCGAGFLVRWLSETDTKVGKVILVAPWLDLGKRVIPDFFDFEISDSIVEKTKRGVIVMYSTDDEKEVIDSVECIKTKVKNINFAEFSGMGHFTLTDMKTEEFPEVLYEAFIW